MTKLETKYGAKRLAIAPSLEGLGQMAMKYYFYDKPPTFVQGEDGRMWMRKPSGAETSVFAVKVGPRFYLMQSQV
jgi:hypothetical protein